MNFRRFRAGDEGNEVSVNLTPLIDVVFLLLIFFMVSTTFTRETHLAIDLPRSSGAVLEQQSRQIEIIISEAGEFSVDGQGLVNSQRETLKRALGKASQGETQLPVIITADANTPYQAVVTAMDAAGQMGFANLSMTTRAEAEE